MGPLSIAQVLKDYGSTGLAALCVCAMVAMFSRLNKLQEQRLKDRDRHVAELREAHDAETAALKLTIPLQEKLAIAVGVLEAKNRRRGDSGAPPSQVAR